MTKLTPRQAFATLTPLRRVAVAAALEYELPARVPKKEVVEALLSSPHTSLELILEPSPPTSS